MTSQMITAVTVERLLRPSEVAGLFRVEVKTVGRWADAGLLPSIRTVGGHRRFRWADVASALPTA
jgi:excisionase family DNA binding protein